MTTTASPVIASRPWIDGAAEAVRPRRSGSARARAMRGPQVARGCAHVPSVAAVVDDDDLVGDAVQPQLEVRGARRVEAMHPSSSRAGMTTESFESVGSRDQAGLLSRGRQLEPVRVRLGVASDLVEDLGDAPLGRPAPRRRRQGPRRGRATGRRRGACAGSDGPRAGRSARGTSRSAGEATWPMSSPPPTLTTRTGVAAAAGLHLADRGAARGRRGGGSRAPGARCRRSRCTRSGRPRAASCGSSRRRSPGRGARTVPRRRGRRSG